jgi:hypothetical protein
MVRLQACRLKKELKKNMQQQKKNMEWFIKIPDNVSPLQRQCSGQQYLASK